MATTMDSPTAVRKGDPFLSFNFLFPYLELKLETITQFRIPGTDKFAKVIDFLRRQLHRDTMFVYVNSAFSPNPDESVIDLYNVRFFIYSIHSSIYLPIH
ncbi:hypothetical protein CsatB_014829 [Cannabis sativa]